MAEWCGVGYGRCVRCVCVYKGTMLTVLLPLSILLSSSYIPFLSVIRDKLQITPLSELSSHLILLRTFVGFSRLFFSNIIFRPPLSYPIISAMFYSSWTQPSSLPQSSPMMQNSALGLQPNSPAPTHTTPHGTIGGKNDLLHPSFLAPCEHSNGDMHAHAFGESASCIV